MKKAFKEKLLREGSADTKFYRYIIRMRQEADSRHVEIRRIRRDALDTTAALSDQSDANPYGWELVKTI